MDATHEEGVRDVDDEEAGGGGGGGEGVEES